MAYVFTHQFRAVFPVWRLQTGGVGLLLAYEDYGFIFKMKMAEVSNPMQRETKGECGWVQIHLTSKNIATLPQMWCMRPRDETVSAIWQNAGALKTTEWTLVYPKQVGAQEPSAHWPIAHYLRFPVGQRLFHWIQKYQEWISPQKFNFQSQQPTTEKKTQKEGKCLLCLLCYFAVVLQGASLHLAFRDCFAIFSNANMTWMRNASYSLALKRTSMMKKCGALVFSPLRRAGENIYHHSSLRR